MRVAKVVKVVDRAPGAWRLSWLPLLCLVVGGVGAIWLAADEWRAWLGVSAGVALVGFVGLRAAWSPMFWSICAILLAGGSAQAYLLVVQRQSLGAVLTILAVAAGIPAALYAYRENHRVYFRPRLRWFQGLPRPIPQVEASWEGVRYRVSRMNHEGAFFYAPSARPAGGVPSRGSVIFHFRDETIPCNVKVMSSFDRGISGYGVGVRFERKSLSESERLAHWIEQLRGEGYVE